MRHLPVGIVGDQHGLPLLVQNQFVEQKTQTGALIMTYLTAEAYDRIRSDPSSVVDLYAQHRDTFTAQAGLLDAPEGVRVAAFCCVMSYDLAPYGHSPALSYPDLLTADLLSCAQYVRLTMWLAAEFGRDDIAFNAVGWDYGNSVPNHCQLFAAAEGVSVLLD